MSFVAKLYQDDRLAERYSVLLDGTLRNPRAEPQDVVVDDLSATGFRTAAMTGVAVGDTVTLGIFGVGLRSATVMRESDGRFGCQFTTPLKPDDLAFALAGLAPPEPVTLRGTAMPGPRSADDTGAGAGEWSLSPRMRMATIAAVGTMPWLALALIWRAL